MNYTMSETKAAKWNDARERSCLLLQGLGLFRTVNNECKYFGLITCQFPIVRIWIMRKE